MQSTIEKLKSLEQYTESIKLFVQLFENAGIHVTDTNEQFSIHQKAGKVSFQTKLNRSSVDYIFETNSEQIDNVIKLASVACVDEINRYKILKSLFNAALTGGVNPFHCLKLVPKGSSLFKNSILRKFLRLKNSVHIYLKTPIKSEPEQIITLLFINGEWEVKQGKVGIAEITFQITIDDTLEFHSEAFKAIKSNSTFQWFKFTRWYLKWRKKVYCPKTKIQ
jgi:hypothetical protein